MGGGRAAGTDAIHPPINAGITKGAFLKSIREFIKAAHICSNQCFNANQEFKHRKPRYGDAYKRFDIAWGNLPLFLRKLLANPRITKRLPDGK